MSHPAVNSVGAAGQSGVTSATEMNGTMTSQSRDSPERSSPPAAAAAASDVIKSSLARTDGRAEAAADAATVSCSDGIIETHTAQQNDISSVATVDTR